MTRDVLSSLLTSDAPNKLAIIDVRDSGTLPSLSTAISS